MNNYKFYKRKLRLLNMKDFFNLNELLRDIFKTHIYSLTNLDLKEKKRQGDIMLLSGESWHTASFMACPSQNKFVANP